MDRKPQDLERKRPVLGIFRIVLGVVRCRTALPPLMRYGPLSCPSTLFQRCPPAPPWGFGSSPPSGPLAPPVALSCVLRDRLRGGGPPGGSPPKARLPYFSPRQRPPRERSLDITNPPVMVSALSLCYIRQKVNRSAPMAGAGKPWTPGKGAGSPGQRQRRETSNARSAPHGLRP